MTTRTMVDPQLLPVLDALPSLDFNMIALDEVRRMVIEMAPGPALSHARSSQEIRVPGPLGGPDVRLLVYGAGESGKRKPAVLHIHGGGYIFGAPEMDDADNQVLAQELDCIVVSVDYRLAPETPFPGAIEDCYAALCWLWRNAIELGVDRDRIAVKGESAGGGLAAALALLARDRGEVKLAFQQLISPMLDDRTVIRTDISPHAGEFVWTAASNRFGWSSLLGQEPGTADIAPYAAPARAPSLAGLPPTFISVGALDLFLEEDIVFASRLLRAGVAVDLHVYSGAFHGFEMGAALGARIAIDAIGTARVALRIALAATA